MSHPMMVFGAKRRGQGRPAMYSERATKRIEFVVTREQRRDLEQVAAQTGQSLAAVVRDAVNAFVSDYGERRVFRSRRR